MYAAYGIVSSLLQLVAKDTYLEASRGTLEHLALARGGLVQQALLRALANILFLTLHLGLLVGILALIFRIPLHPMVWFPLPFLALLLASLGFSFLMGAMALLFRRVSSTFVIVQFLFAPYFFILLEWKPFMAYLPFAPGAHLLRQGLTGGSFDPLLFLLALSQGVALASAGLWAFARIYAMARRQGIFGRY
jgi:ABC-2 type transport system permease protein